MASSKKYISLLLLAAAVLTLPPAIELANIRTQVFNPSRIAKLVNDILDRPKELGRFIHKKAVKKLIAEQEATSFTQVPKHLVLLSFFDADEWQRVIRYAINREALGGDIEKITASVLAGEQAILYTGSYLDQIKTNLPDFTEMFLGILPRCNAKQEAWFGNNSYIPLKKNMPKCLPCNPHRDRIKWMAIGMIKGKLGAAPPEVDITEKLQKKTGKTAKEIARRIAVCKTTMALLWLLPAAMLIGGAFLRGGNARARCRVFSAALVMAGLLTIFLTAVRYMLPLPLAVLAGYTACALLIEGLALAIAGLAIGLALWKTARGR